MSNVDLAPGPAQVLSVRCACKWVVSDPRVTEPSLEWAQTIPSCHAATRPHPWVGPTGLAQSCWTRKARDMFLATCKGPGSA